jgi:alpha-D-xyloside xylohydrolase
MVYEYPDDPVAQAADLQYLLGPDLLVAPFYRSGGSRPVWFPPGQWAHYRNGQVAQAGFQEVSLPTDVAPLWLRAGSSLLLTEPRQRIGDGRYDNLTVTLTTTRSSPPRAVRLVVTSYGEAAISVEPTSDGGVAISTPPGLPRLDVVVVGNQPIAGVVTINGTPVASRTSSSLMSEQTRRALGGQEREGGGRPDD